MAAIKATQKACCDYDAREDERQHPKPKQRVLTSTRVGKPGSDAHRDMDGFDVDEELARLRIALQRPTVLNPATAGFIREAFRNIDEHLVRGGTPPTAWAGTSKGRRA
jgi:hypothetical protein